MSVSTTLNANLAMERPGVFGRSGIVIREMFGGYLLLSEEGTRGVEVGLYAQSLQWVSRKKRTWYLHADVGNSARRLRLLKHPGVRCVTFVGSMKAAKQYREHLTRLIEEATDLPEVRWWLGLDVGRSAETIFRVLMSDEARDWLDGQQWYGNQPLRAESFTSSTPHDDGDWGRCLRLVDQFAWRDRLEEVVAKHPEWRAIVDQWDAQAARLMPPGGA